MRHKLAALALLIGCIAAASAATPPPTSSADCPTPFADTTAFARMPYFTTNAPRGTLKLSAVTNTESRERGLMCVVSVPPGRGMIFVFPGDDTEQGFWMKNTLVNLDMVFVSQNGVVTAVAANVPATKRGTPDDKVARRSGIGKFVIELAAGDAARHGIVAGTKLVFPALKAEDE
jgi:hypothetical protein